MCRLLSQVPSCIAYGRSGSVAWPLCGIKQVSRVLLQNKRFVIPKHARMPRAHSTAALLIVRKSCVDVTAV